MKNPRKSVESNLLTEASVVFSLLSLMTPVRVTAIERPDLVAHLSSQHFGLYQSHLPFHLPFHLSDSVFISVTTKNLCFCINIGGSAG